MGPIEQPPNQQAGDISGHEQPTATCTTACEGHKQSLSQQVLRIYGCSVAGNTCYDVAASLRTTAVNTLTDPLQSEPQHHLMCAEH
jgi:hypothetical protein